MPCDILEEPVRFLVCDADYRDPGLTCNPAGIDHIEPRDHAPGQQNYIDVPAPEVADHLQDRIRGIHRADRHGPEREAVDAQVLPHDDPREVRQGPARVTLRNTKCPKPFFGHVHRSTYVTRLKIVYQRKSTRM